MYSTKCNTSACRYCHSYQPEGRRGGMCQQLGVTVQAQWKSCNFAKPIFSVHGENLEGIALLEKSFGLTYDQQNYVTTRSELNPCLSET